MKLTAVRFLDVDPFRSKVNNLTGFHSDIGMRGIDAPYANQNNNVGALAPVEISNIVNSSSFSGAVFPPNPGGSTLHVLGIQGGALKWVKTTNC
jgi:hypothetical protein